MFRFNNASFIAACAAGLLCADLFAGGFWLQLGDPSANPDAKAKNAVVIVRPFGCISPADAKLTGTAEGMLNGQRRTIALDLVPLSEKATYAVLREWPAEGSWVLRLTASVPGRTTSALVPVTAEGFNRAMVKFFQGDPPRSDLEAMLHTMAAQQLAAKN
ncbi:MAG TPA: hypothetical protein VFA04_05520 [Bryobacteraceae bacterium]|nr:hypothetical protein [Bryobacteraceae bacterium]